MLHENTMVRNAAAELQQIFMSENPDATAVEAAFDQFGQAIAASVLADYQSANGDRQRLRAGVAAEIGDDGHKCRHPTHLFNHGTETGNDVGG